MDRRSKHSGFSLIEIMVVLVIMGLLVGIVAPNVLKNVDDANVKTVYADFRSIETSLKLYRLDNFVYPSTEQGLSALVEKTALEPVPRKFPQSGYLDDLPTDPWQREYVYISPGESHDYDLISYGADGVPGGEGQNADLNVWNKPE
ncbi:type II secretion system major pseudopilin GspG [Sessilibacter corallicola]|uniref:Type II secretion system core protein G n=1 Tax=Sessilibacter corallicola TaxID=2904075 RepID=A0ABQ0ABN8_9GAMM|nr:type II secretion system major pseudopilin GspG [Sessilibacter corallicola]MCE2027967.1 type II secretion system major pseudopilin GspG [Sessilibacter corallicola]